MVECEVCNLLTKTCEKLGNKKLCTDLIEDLKKDKITEEELVNKIIKHFTPEKFNKEWDKTAENEVS